MELLNVLRVYGWNGSERGDTPLNDTRSGRPLTTRNSERFGELVRKRRMAPNLMDD